MRLGVVLCLVSLAVACSGTHSGGSPAPDGGGSDEPGEDAAAPDKDSGTDERADSAVPDSSVEQDASEPNPDASGPDASGRDASEPDSSGPDPIEPNCGNGDIEGDEACDDGNRATETACPYGVSECEHCNIDCTAQLHFTGRYCGDGIEDPEEQCDDGAANSDDWSVTAHCNDSCTGIAPFCGDDNVDTFVEECDDGASNSDSWQSFNSTPLCNTTCSGLGPHCGDGEIDLFETCDDGEDNSDSWSAEPHCRRNCGGVAPHCGNGVRESPEACDAGENATTEWHHNPTCLPGCFGYAPHCGDGVHDMTHEVCDRGAQNSYEWSVLPGCAPGCDGPGPHCGDGYLYGYEEQCEDGDRASGDGCGPTCARESGYACDTSSVPTACIPCSTPVYIHASSTAAEPDGASWATAYPTFEAAYAGSSYRYGQCGSSLTLWVGEGTYRPSSSGNRSSYFGFWPHSNVYGGFAGTETALDQRDIEAHESVLSGDLTGDDAQPNGRTNNSYHVVRIGVSNFVLDGFTIRGGYANGSTFEGYGGGLFASDVTSVVLRNLVIEDNFATQPGGGVLVRGQSRVAVDNVLFRNNESQASGGGLMHFDGTIELTDITVLDNRGSGLGGGICNNSGTITIDGAHFEGNEIPNGSGGGLFASGTSKVSNATFVDNHGQSAGGMGTLGTRAELYDVRFIDNSALFSGGALTIGSTTALVIDAHFYGNTAAIDGGAIEVYSGKSADFIQMVVSGNSATRNGGAANIQGVARFSNLAFANNTAGGLAGAIYDTGGTTLTQMDNSVAWGNGVNPFVVAAGGSAFDLHWSCVEGGMSGFYNQDQCGPGGTGSPFVDADGADNIAGTIDDDLHLAPGSLAIDTGRVAPAVANFTEFPFDLDGNPRAVGQLDRGPYEVQPPSP